MTFKSKNYLLAPKTISNNVLIYYYIVWDGCKELLLSNEKIKGGDKKLYLILMAGNLYLLKRNISMKDNIKNWIAHEIREIIIFIYTC